MHEMMCYILTYVICTSDNNYNNDNNNTMDTDNTSGE